MFCCLILWAQCQPICAIHISLRVLCLMLWSQIIYGHCTASISPKNRTILQRPYGARPPAGSIVWFFIIFLDIVRCPVKFRYYFKFHGARMAFGRVIEGKITSANFLLSWASVVFITITVRVSLNLSHFNNLFLWRNDGEFSYKCIHHCTWKFE